MSGGYNPTQTEPNSPLIKTQVATYKGLGTSTDVAALGRLVARLRLHLGAPEPAAATSASGTDRGACTE